MSRRVAGILCPGVTGRVLASFSRVCDLVTDDGAVVALVWGGVGDGALNVVLAREPGAALPAGTRFAVHRQENRHVPGTSQVPGTSAVILRAVSHAGRGATAHENVTLSGFTTQGALRRMTSEASVRHAQDRSLCGATDSSLVACRNGAHGVNPLRMTGGRPIFRADGHAARGAMTSTGKKATAIVYGRSSIVLLVDLSSAMIWDPRPDWEALQARRAQIVAAAPVIQKLLADDAVRRAAHNSENEELGLSAQIPIPGAVLRQVRMAHHQDTKTPRAQGMGDALCPSCLGAFVVRGRFSGRAAGIDTVTRAGAALNAIYRHGDRDALATAVRTLCGLGPGLTPAGDDWLAGWLLGLHLAPDPKGLGDLSDLVTDIAAARTTTLSRAFLECAAAGEADASWHALLDALAGESANERVEKSARAILAHGDTSGAAMLGGFLAGID